MPGGTASAAASTAMTSDSEHDRAPTSGSSPRTASGGYQTDSTQPADSPGHQSGSGEPADSPGYQSGSGEPPSFSEVPGSEPSEKPADEEELVDPYTAYAQVAAKARSEKERRDPSIWLPGGDELDAEEGRDASRETRFSADSWSGRGNPQVSVRLRPLDFGRLRQAADLYGVRPTTLARMMVIRGVGAILDAELRRDGEFLRERGRY